MVNQAARRRLGPVGFHPHSLVFAYKLQRHSRFWLGNKSGTVMGNGNPDFY